MRKHDVKLRVSQITVMITRGLTMSVSPEQIQDSDAKARALNAILVTASSQEIDHAMCSGENVEAAIRAYTLASYYRQLAREFKYCWWVEMCFPGVKLISYL
jgi:hypothetical protein